MLTNLVDSLPTAMRAMLVVVLSLSTLGPARAAPGTAPAPTATTRVAFLPLAAHNQWTRPPIVINEINLRPAGTAGSIWADQWIELHNPTTADINLKGWTVTREDGSPLATLPDWDFQHGTYLLIRLQDGQNDADFSDGNGTFFAGANAPALDSAQDGVALYQAAPPGPSSLVDFVAWGPGAQRPLGVAGIHAVGTGLWPQGMSVAIGFGAGSAVLIPGETLGRNAPSLDTNQPSDFTDHGGQDSFIVTAGKQNSTLAALPAWFLSKKRPSTHANALLISLGWKVSDTTVSHEQFVRTGDAITATATHRLSVADATFDEQTFLGNSTASWHVGHTGVVTEQVHVAIAPGGDLTSTQAMTSTFQRVMERDSLGVTAHTVWTMRLAGQSEPFYQLSQSLQTTLLDANTHRTTSQYTLKPGHGLDVLAVVYTRTETIVAADMVQGQLQMTIDDAGQASALSTAYQRRMFEDLDALAFLQGVALPVDENATYTVFDLTTGGQAYHLAQVPGHTTITKTSGGPGYQGTFAYDWRILLEADGGATLSFGMDGELTVPNAFPASLVHGVFTYLEGGSMEMTIDPEIDPFVGVWIKGGALVIGVVGAVVTIWSWATADNTAPELIIREKSTDCNGMRGRRILSIVADDWGYPVDSSFNAVVQNPPAGISSTYSQVYGHRPTDLRMINGYDLEILNTTPQAVTVTVMATVQDEAGNTRNGFFSTVIPGACEVP